MSDLNFQNAKQALENYCAYQERCSSEIHKKLDGFELSNSQRNQIIKDLQVNNFFSDPRYCSSVVSGKFRINRWGKLKIRAFLKQKNLPETLILDALNEIDDDAYNSTIAHLLQRKSQEIKEKDGYKKQAKLIRYLLSKGYEFDRVKEAVQNVL
jgi:regulatory protein